MTEQCELVNLCPSDQQSCFPFHSVCCWAQQQAGVVFLHPAGHASPAARQRVILLQGVLRSRGHKHVTGAAAAFAVTRGHGDVVLLVNGDKDGPELRASHGVACMPDSLGGQKISISLGRVQNCTPSPTAEPARCAPWTCSFPCTVALVQGACSTDTLHFVTYGGCKDLPVSARPMPWGLSHHSQVQHQPCAPVRWQ